ncbi:hypothetical protein GBA52_021718 [Prunus armeniaca]|nr:hypothetical protein GBA52_021718 [Prunus armeniaca]
MENLTETLWRGLSLAYDMNYSLNCKEPVHMPVVNMADTLFTEWLKNMFTEWHDGLAVEK